MLSSAEAWGRGGRRIGRMQRLVGNRMDERTERNGRDFLRWPWIPGDVR